MASARLEVNVQFAKNLSRMQRGWSKPLLNASPTGHRICHALRRQHALQDVTPALWRAMPPTLTVKLRLRYFALRVELRVR